MSRIFIGVDAQVDFIDGALANKDAQNTVVMLNRAANDAREKDFDINWTLDTHGNPAEYGETLEGRLLPVPHCERDTPGWQLHEAIEAEADDPVFEKPTFGSIEMLNSMIMDNEVEPIELIVIGGYCTDICVVSNALLLRAGLPNTKIVFLKFASAGTTPYAHDAATEVMKSCQIFVAETYSEYKELLDDLD